MAAEVQRFEYGILILHAVPQNPSLQLLLSNYGHAVEQALVGSARGLSDSYGAKGLARLDIAVLTTTDTADRSASFPSLQRLFARVYMIVVHVAARVGIDLDFGRGVDARIFTIEAGSSRAQDPCDGPCISLEAFVAAQRGYGHYWILETPKESPTAAYLDAIYKLVSSSRSTTETVHSAAACSDTPETLSSLSVAHTPSSKHTRVAVGGTFDHLHIGHKLLLTATVLIAQPGSEQREITVGITGDELLVNKKHAEVLESWEMRQQRVADFLESILAFHSNVKSIRSIQTQEKPGPNGKVVKVSYQSPSGEDVVTINYTQISDPFGPTITDESISALVISAETRAGGKAVNDKRGEKGWAALEVFEVDVLDATMAEKASNPPGGATKTSFDSKISSTEIRKRLTAS